ncbi:MAG: hypothetical protein IIZ39_08065 [Blautia sp.]|nr:hypothetical protein [Blautia sp.]
MERPNQNTALVLIAFSVLLRICSHLTSETTMARILGIGIFLYAITLFWEAKADSLQGTDWVADSLKAVAAFILGALVLAQPGYIPAFMGILFLALGVFGILEYLQNASRSKLPYFLHGITIFMGIFLFFFPFGAMPYLIRAVAMAFLYVGITGLLSEY